jgi:hypothetical protein
MTQRVLLPEDKIFNYLTAIREHILLLPVGDDERDTLLQAIDTLLQHYG